MKIVLIGAPGSGKGTLGVGLEKMFGFKHISVGKLMRDEAKTNIKIKQTIEKGCLVNNKTIKKILAKRLNEEDCQRGFILDGYPRSLAQAKDLTTLTNIDYVFYLQINQQEIFRRLRNRLSCINCNMVYDKSTENIITCKVCGGQLQMRADDNFQTIQNRIKVFNTKTKPLLEVFKTKVVNVPAMGLPQEVLNFVAKKIKEGAKKVDCKNC